MRALAAVIVLGALIACAREGPEPASGSPLTLGQLLASADVTGYELALEPRPFTFPPDHSSHPRFKTEWWYFTGNLTDAHGAAFGFQLAFFRFALTPRDARDDSAWQTRDAWLAHFAVTDVARGAFHASERISRDGLGLAGSSSDPYEIWIEDWSAVAGGPDAFPLRLRASTKEAGIDLELRATRQPVANGERGLDRKGPEPGNASYYYSVPRLVATGTLRVGESRHSVSGSAWMDREWSSNALSVELAGWDWMCLDLSDGDSLMVYRLRTADGGSSPFSSGTLIAADGRRVVLARDDVVLTPRDHWTSPATGVRYPIAWSVRLPDQNLELEVRALIPNQELDLAVRYWEGAVGATGSSHGRPVTGTGYLELTGY